MINLRVTSGHCLMHATLGHLSFKPVRVERKLFYTCKYGTLTMVSAYQTIVNLYQ